MRCDTGFGGVITLSGSQVGTFTSLKKSPSLALQTNGSNAVVIDNNQNANFTSTGAVTIPAGTTNNRPTAVNGMIRYNTSTANLEAYVSGVWITFP